MNEELLVVQVKECINYGNKLLEGMICDLQVTSVIRQMGLNCYFLNIVDCEIATSILSAYFHINNGQLVEIKINSYYDMYLSQNSHLKENLLIVDVIKKRLIGMKKAIE